MAYDPKYDKSSRIEQELFKDIIRMSQEAYIADKQQRKRWKNMENYIKDRDINSWFFVKKPNGQIIKINKDQFLDHTTIRLYELYGYIYTNSPELRDGLDDNEYELVNSKGYTVPLREGYNITPIYVGEIYSIRPIINFHMRRYDRKSKTRKSKTRKSKTRKSKTRKSKTRKSKTRKSKTRKSKTRKSKTRKSKTRKSNTRKSSRKI